MSTNAILAYPNADGTVTTTYVHYDGYISYTGKMLAFHYNNGVAAYNICHTGYLSSIEPTIGKSLSASVNSQSPVVYDSLDEMFNDLDDPAIEYIYVWTLDGEWVVLSKWHEIYSIPTAELEVD